MNKIATLLFALHVSGAACALNAQEQNMQTGTSSFSANNPSAAADGHSQDKNSSNQHVTDSATSIAMAASLQRGQDQQTMDVAREVINGTNFVTRGKAGRVVQVYGEALPWLICRPLTVCTIELEPGEVIIEPPALSDTARWELTQYYRDANAIKPQQDFLLLKPKPDAVDANLFVLTDRRAYTIMLKKDENVHTPILSFDYPDTRERLAHERAEERRQNAKRVKTKQKVERSKKVAHSGVPTVTGVRPADELEFDFCISGTAPFKPSQVYTDGQKTYVVFPDGYRGKPIPHVVPGRGVTNKEINIKVSGDGLRLTISRFLHDFTIFDERHRIRVQKRSG